MRIITAANHNYFERIAPYLDSITAHTSVPVTLICTGDQGFRQFPGVDSKILTRKQNWGSPRETESPQHGAFLQVVTGPLNEILIFTDGDILMQRDFSPDEIDWLNDLDDGVACGYNSGPDETLAIEAQRLFPKVSPEMLDRAFGLQDRPCYNIGVIAARHATWQCIYETYLPKWELVTEALGHMARQQWLVCWTFARLGLPVKVTPYSFHANGHYGIPPGCNYRDGKLYADDDLVLFRHKL